MESKKPTRILLVEDNPADARLVEIYLQESALLSPRLSRVTELKKAMLLLEENDFDIVLLDLTLSDSSGFNTVKTMLNEFPMQTVIVMTGLEDDAVAINSVKAGAQDFIVKGQFDSNLLSRTISYAIERHQLQIKLENYAKTIALNEQRLLEAQKMARMGNWELDIVNNQMFWSDEVFRILGYKENSFEPSLADFLKHIEGDEKTAVRNAINRTMEKGKSLQIEYQVQLPGSGVKNIAISAQIQLSKKNKGLCLSGTIQDISNFTQRKNKEIPDLATLESNLQKMMTMLDHSPKSNELNDLIKNSIQLLPSK